MIGENWAWSDDEDSWRLAVEFAQLEARQHHPCTCSDAELAERVMNSFYTAGGTTWLTFRGYAETPAERFQSFLSDLEAAGHYKLWPRTARRRIDAVELTLIEHGRIALPDLK